MRIKVVLSLLKKEFLNIIRDRKSFLTMILLPLLMFPMIVGLMSIMLTMFTKIDSKITFGVDYEVTEDFKKFVDDYSDVYEIEILYDNAENLKEKFDSGEIGIYVLKDNNEYLMHFDENNTSSIASSTLVEKIYKDYKEVYIANILEESGINYQELQDSFKISFVQESITEMGSFVPSMISMVLTMMISSVCFSVAIEITTSEKEKGTLETLLSLPLKKAEIITSKYLTVFILSTMSGLLTYISLFGTLYFAKDTLSLLGVAGLNISFKVLLIYLISIILLSLLFSGLLLSITIFSKTLKEAQNSLYPLELLVAFVSMLPMFGIKGSYKSAFIPFANISLLFNNALSTNVDGFFVLITFVTTIIYAIILIFIVSKIYNQEDVLFNTKSLSYLTFKKGKLSRDYLSPFATVVLLAVIYSIAAYLSILFMTSNKNFLLALMPLTIFAVNTVVCVASKINIPKSIKLNGFSFKKFICLIPFYLGVYFLSEAVINVVINIFPSITDTFSLLTDQLTFDNLFMGLFIVAVLPAIAEEYLFRGIVLNSFNKKYGKTVAIVASALLFGIFHMNWVQGINAFIVGLALGYIYVKTNSIVTVMIIHFLNNGYSVLASFYPSLELNIYNSSIYYILLSVCAVVVILTLYILEFLNKNGKKGAN